MSSDKRRAAATATVGYAGVGGAAALRHTALDQRYGKDTRPKVPFGHELGFLRRGAKGRKLWLTGAAIGGVALPAAAKGTNDLLRKSADDPYAPKRSFLREGLAGTKDAWTDRTSNLAEKPPAKLVAGNYALGAAIGSGAGGLAHLGLGRTKLGGAARAAVAASTAVGTGSATIPLQSRVINRATHGKYEATPNGVRRLKRKPVKPSRYAETQRPGSPVTKAGLPIRLHRMPRSPKLDRPLTPEEREQVRASLRRVTPKTIDSRATNAAGDQVVVNLMRRRHGDVAKMSPRAAANTLGAVTGAHWTTNLSRVADRIEPYEARRAKPKPLHPVVARHLPNAHRVSTKLVRTGRTKAAETVRAVSYDVSSLNDKDKLVREVATGQGRVQKDDPGASLSRGQRRALVTASGPPVPVVGDLAQAVQAARLSPERYRRRTAVQNYAGGQAGGLAGNAAGAAGALALANHSPKFAAGADKANAKIEGAKDALKRKAGIKPRTGPSLLQRVPGVARTTRALKATRAGAAVARRPGVAAVGALVGGGIGGQTGQQLTYGRVMTRDDKYRRSQNRSAAHGSKFGKADLNTGMSRREEVAQIRRKQRSAALSATTSAGSIGATGMLAASYLPKIRTTARAGKLRTASFGVGTVAGGLGAINGLEGAHLQRRDLKARRRVLESKGGVSKALVPTGIRRAPAMRRGFVRQTRYRSGITRVSTVRGGLA